METTAEQPERTDYAMVYVAKDVHEAIRNMAKDDGRTIGGLVSWLVRQELARRQPASES